MNKTIGVVDLFAGPGGLSEGFASVQEDKTNPFQIAISIEKEATAYQTLRLRAFLREYRLRHNCLPKEYIDFHAGVSPQFDWDEVDSVAWKKANSDIFQMELGKNATTVQLNERIEELQSKYDESVLIGGPPCQAYSLVGRARARGNTNYRAHEDNRHYLFKEYIRVLEKLRPAAFIMENVKGILSSTVQSKRIFSQLMDDLSSLGTAKEHQYEIFAIKLEQGNLMLTNAQRPSDFVVKTENLGIAQRRHRVFIIGVRLDLAPRVKGTKAKAITNTQTVAAAIGNLPRVRSGLSKDEDTFETWVKHTRNAATNLSELTLGEANQKLNSRLTSLASQSAWGTKLFRSVSELPEGYGKSNNSLLQWLENTELKAVAQHETRGHMNSDLERYLYAACFGEINGFSPKAKDFPAELSPNHSNWHSGIFSDRFRVQLSNETATTITSHISKDGHYFIHPDPSQCRTLTVREAARLQSFPDDYLFLGPRTAQYVQVGNAVPPYVAKQLANLIYKLLY